MNAHVNSGITWSGSLVAVVEALGSDAARQWVGLLVSLVLGLLGLYIHVSERRERERRDEEERQRRREDAARYEAARLAELERRAAEREAVTKGQ